MQIPPRSGLLWLAFLAISAAALGCRRPAPPTEKVLPAVRPAPLLNEIEDDEGAVQVASPGELLLPGRVLATLRWHGPMEGKPAERQGEVLEVIRGPGEGILFGFRSDLGAEIQAPTARWLCERAAEHRPALRPSVGDCSLRLRRFRVGRDAFAAVAAFTLQAFPVMLARGSDVRFADAPSPVETRIIDLGGRPLLVLDERRSEDGGRHTSGHLVFYRFTASGPEPRGEVLTDEVDARSADRVVARSVGVSYEGNAVRLRGDRRETALDGRELGHSPIDETHSLEGR